MLSNYPKVQCLLPKSHIGLQQLLENNPTYDGRGTVIAIWDTGIDPAAPGLQVTSDGRQKVLDFIDASGSGDVPMKVTQTITDQDRSVVTLTGRRVTIPKHWKPVNGVIRMGVKLASEVFPKSLLQRIRNEARELQWRPGIKQAAANLVGDLVEVDDWIRGHSMSQLDDKYTKRQSPSPLGETNTLSPGVRRNRSLSGDSVEKAGVTQCSERPAAASPRPDSRGRQRAASGTRTFRQLLKSQVATNTRLLQESLSVLDQCVRPLEMVFDCFVFFDGTRWLACVDTSCYQRDKRLDDMPLLADYTVTPQYACFGDDTQLFYTVKILNKGRLMQIVANSGGHGTHVASMAAAYFPSHGAGDSPTGDESLQRDGVAPAAQLVSIKIADTRIGSCETGISLLRAIRWTVDMKCDIVNYSFGEFSIWPNVGRVCSHLSGMVAKHGVVMVASGGNNGPGLGTVGCPGGVTDHLIGVAPLVFPDMMRALYSQPCRELSAHPNHLSPAAEITTGGSDSSPGPSDDDRVTEPVASAYTWGSRGPALDGGLGLCVSAPGAANTSVAAWQLKPTALQNGSSMSSPLVAGGVAVLLSGLRQYFKEFPDLSVSPGLIRLALVNSAEVVPHLSVLDQGFGVLHLTRAFEFLVEAVGQLKGGDPAYIHRHLSSPDHWWSLRCRVSGPGCLGNSNSATAGSRGIWLRKGWPSSGLSGRCDRPKLGTGALPLLRYSLDLQIDFKQSVPLECRRQLELHLITELCNKSLGESSALQPSDWVQVSPMVSLTSAGRQLQLVIDPNRFPKTISHRLLVDNEDVNDPQPSSAAGDGHVSPQTTLAVNSGEIPVSSCECHVTLLSLKDAFRPFLGALVQVPIVVQFPIRLSSDGDQTPRLAIRDRFDAGHKVRRWFIQVPPGATAGILYLSRCSDDLDQHCQFRVVVTFPQLRCGLTVGEQEVRWPMMRLAKALLPGTAARLDVESATRLVFPIAQWETDCLELTIAQQWGIEAPATVAGELRFHGLEPSLRQLDLHASHRYARLSVRSNFTTEALTPKVSLTHWELPLRPSESHIVYLGHGESEVLTSGLGCYALRLVYRFTCPFKTPETYFQLSLLHQLLYESDYLLHLYHIYDSAGRLVMAGEYDEANKQKRYIFPVDKGVYTAIVQICHEDGHALTCLSNLSDRKLNSDLATASDQPSGGANRVVKGTPPAAGIASKQSKPSPLERLRQQPAVVRFRLPTGAEKVGCSPSDRRAFQIVNFEFAAFPFSLGLAGEEPQSTVVASTSAAEHVVLTGRQQDCQQAELVNADVNRRSPCLPKSLNQHEVTSLYVSLVDENYPPYAIPGSYFSGRIGFHHSEPLNSGVTYPLRLLMDTGVVSSYGSGTRLPTRKESRRSSGSPVSPVRLQVESLGLSSGDLDWLTPAAELVLLHQLDSSCPTLGADYDNGSNNNSCSWDPGAVPSPAVRAPGNGSTQALADLGQHELPSVISAAPSVGEDKQSLKVSTSECGNDGVDGGSSSFTTVDEHVLEEHKLTRADNDLQSPTTGDRKLASPRAGDTGSSPLGDLFTRLSDLDVVPSPVQRRQPLERLRQQRSRVWALADRLLLGRALNSSSSPVVVAVGSSAAAEQASGYEEDETVPMSGFGTDGKQTGLRYLLTLQVSERKPDRTGRARQSTGAAGHAHKGKKKQAAVTATASGTQTAASARVGTPASSPLGSDVALNSEPKDDGGAQNPGELKLLLVDCLARYGRLLCERLLVMGSSDSNRRLDLTDTWQPVVPSQLSECAQLADEIHSRLLCLVAAPGVEVGARALPAWLLANPAATRGCTGWGSVGGRLLVFFLVYSVARCRYGSALRLLARIVYQVEDPPAHSYLGVNGCELLHKRLGVRASLETARRTASRASVWLVWLLNRLGWTNLARYTQVQLTTALASRDFTLLGAGSDLPIVPVSDALGSISN